MRKLIKLECRTSRLAFLLKGSTSKSLGQLDQVHDRQHLAARGISRKFREIESERQYENPDSVSVQLNTSARSFYL